MQNSKKSIKEFETTKAACAAAFAKWTEGESNPKSRVANQTPGNPPVSAHESMLLSGEIKNKSSLAGALGAESFQAGLPPYIQV